MSVQQLVGKGPRLRVTDGSRLTQPLEPSTQRPRDASAQLASRSPLHQSDEATGIAEQGPARDQSDAHRPAGGPSAQRRSFAAPETRHGPGLAYSFRIIG